MLHVCVRQIFFHTHLRNWVWASRGRGGRMSFPYSCSMFFKLCSSVCFPECTEKCRNLSNFGVLTWYLYQFYLQPLAPKTLAFAIAKGSLSCPLPVVLPSRTESCRICSFMKNTIRSWKCSAWLLCECQHCPSDTISHRRAAWPCFSLELQPWPLSATDYLRGQ